jgi:Rrf2 family transcriptional regulator, iron-sulfur cluster assembly transcription factor
VLILSRKEILAIAAVIEIAVNARDGPISARTITVRQKMPVRHLDRILQRLVHNGILTSGSGSRGGYQLAREPGLITIDDVVRSMIEAEEGDRPLSKIERKIVIPALREAEAMLSETLGRLTIDDLAHAARAESATTN